MKNCRTERHMQCCLVRTECKAFLHSVGTVSVVTTFQLITHSCPWVCAKAKTRGRIGDLETSGPQTKAPDSVSSLVRCCSVYVCLCFRASLFLNSSGDSRTRDHRIVRCDICSVQLQETLPEEPHRGKLESPFTVISVIDLVLLC